MESVIEDEKDEGVKENLLSGFLIGGNLMVID